MWPLSAEIALFNLVNFSSSGDGGGGDELKEEVDNGFWRSFFQPALVYVHSIFKSSTSKTKVALGGMTPGCPVAP